MTGGETYHCSTQSIALCVCVCACVCVCVMFVYFVLNCGINGQLGSLIKQRTGMGKTSFVLILNVREDAHAFGYPMCSTTIIVSVSEETFVGNSCSGIVPI